MVIFEEGKYLVVKFIADENYPDKESHYQVVNKDHPEVVEFSTTCLYESIRVSKIYSALLIEAMEFVPNTNWGAAKADVAKLIDKGKTN